MGHTIIIIILIVIAFQVIILQVKQEKRHREITDILNKMEEKMDVNKR
jgi:preprotein translocase subunit YajC